MTVDKVVLGNLLLENVFTIIFGLSLCFFFDKTINLIDYKNSVSRVKKPKRYNSVCLIFFPVLTRYNSVCSIVYRSDVFTLSFLHPSHILTVVTCP